MQNDPKLNANDIYLSTINGKETLRVGVGVALIDEKSRLLLELRSDVSMWGITGGKLDPGETPKQCGIREVDEETGIRLQEDQLEFFGIYAQPEDGRILQYPDNRVHLLDIVFKAKICSASKLQLSSESTELSFFSVKNIPRDIVPPAQRPIEDLIRRCCIK